MITYLRRFTLRILMYALQSDGRFSTEPGYGTANDAVAANQGVEVDVRWYGKPYGPAFNLALAYATRSALVVRLITL